MRDLLDIVAWIVLLAGVALFAAEFTIRAPERAWSTVLVLAMVVAVRAGIVSIRRKPWRRRRMATGRCPTCRYDMRYAFGGGCPECGWRRST